MRIIGGKYKGRIFNPGKKFKSRPTTDVAKEGLFNILENRYYFDSKKVLDLFSGTGGMGYEFASHGAKEIVFVEKSYLHFKFIQTTLNTLQIENGKVIKTDVFLFLKKSTDKFDIIFADPPFDLKSLPEIPDQVLNSNLLNDSGIFILEHPKEFNFTSHPRFSELRKYGKVNFSFFS